MTTEIIETIVDIPKNVNVTLEGKKITVNGSKGKVIKDFTHTNLHLEKNDENIRIWIANPRKRQTAQVNTLSSHIKNMIKGVDEGFTYRLKIVFIHFPMTIRIQENILTIENFIGERQARTAKILPNVKIQIDGDDIIVEGPDIDTVSQTAANIQQATKIRNKDLRKFLDGIYVYSRE